MASLDTTDETTEVGECFLTLLNSAARHLGSSVTDLGGDMVTAYVVALFDGKPHKTIKEITQVEALRAILNDSLAKECERLWA